MHHPGQLIMAGKYKLQELLGKGAQGEVWAAQQMGIGLFVKDVVLKFVAVNGLDQQKLQASLLHEARISAELSHPAIVTVFDVGEEDGQVFLAMERIRGMDLSRVAELQMAVHQIPMPWELVCYIIKRVCRGLHFAHVRVRPDGEPMGIIHRDLKPHNILVSEQGEVKLIDFGIAKVEQSLRKTQTDMVKGTPAYMSPEQIAAQALDSRSDLFSLGVILYELLSGEVPFYAAQMFSMLYLIMECKPRPLQEVAPQLPPALTALVMQLLSKNRAKRPASAKAIRVAIDDILMAEGVRVNEDNLLDYFEELQAEGAHLLANPDSGSFSRLTEESTSESSSPGLPVEGTLAYSDPDDPLRVRPPLPTPAPGIGHTVGAVVPPQVVWSQQNLPPGNGSDDDDDPLAKTTPDPEPLDEQSSLYVQTSDEVPLDADTPAFASPGSLGLLVLVFALGGAIVWAFFGGTSGEPRPRSPGLAARSPPPKPSLPDVKIEPRTPARARTLVPRPPSLEPDTRALARVVVPRAVRVRPPARQRVWGQLKLVLQPAMLLFEERGGKRRRLGEHKRLVLKRRKGRYCFFATNQSKRVRVSFCANVVPGRTTLLRKSIRFGEVRVQTKRKGLVFLNHFGSVGVTGAWLKLPVGRHSLKVVQADDLMKNQRVEVKVLVGQRTSVKVWFR